VSAEMHVCGNSPMQSLSLIIKSTRKCNLRCEYCHDWRSRGETIPFNILATLMAKALRLPEHQRVEFIWHGGEPLLLGLEFYKKALYLQHTFCQEGQDIRNCLQTNGTLVDENWACFFRDYGFHIGISIDGPKSHHDVTRAYASGKGSFDDVMRAIDTLQKHGVRFGLLMVLDDSSLLLDPSKLFHFFLGLGVKSFSFLLVRPSNLPGTRYADLPNYGITYSQYVQFMKQIFDVWYELDDPSIQIRELTSIVNVLAGGFPTVCMLAGKCLGYYFGVEPNGDLYHCDKYLGDKQYLLGNIMEHSFRDIRGSEHFLRLVENNEREIQELRLCPWFEVCQGGCQHDRYIAAQYSSTTDENCCSLRELIEYIYERISSELAMDIPNQDHRSHEWIS